MWICTFYFEVGGSNEENITKSFENTRIDIIFGIRFLCPTWTPSIKG